MAPWLDHVGRKTHLDVMLDSIVKSGHSVVQDGCGRKFRLCPWLGIAWKLGPGVTALRAVRLSAYTALSLKDYEGLAGFIRKRCETVGGRHAHY